MADSELKKSLQQSVRETWMSALGVVTGVEGEVARATGRLLDSLGLPRDEAGHLAAGEIVARIRRNRDELERRVDEGVRSAVGRVRLPIAQEIAALRLRVERLQSKVEELAHRRRKRSGEGDSP